MWSFSIVSSTRSTFTANQKFPHTFPMGTLEMHAALQPFFEVVLDSNHTCLLLSPLLLPLVIWTTEKLFVLRKNPLSIFCCFPGFSSTCTYYYTMLYHYKLYIPLTHVNSTNTCFFSDEITINIPTVSHIQLLPHNKLHPAYPGAHSHNFSAAYQFNRAH